MATKQHEDNFDFEANLNLVEKKLARLRALYEQYFLGIEKRPPTIVLKDVVRLIRRLENHPVRKTSLKFRLSGVVQKFNTYRTYWSRISRQIENGTYLKHKKKVKTRAQRQLEADAAEEAALEAAINAAIEADGPSPAPPPQPESSFHKQTGSLADEFLNQLQGSGSSAPPPPRVSPSRPVPQVRGMSAEDLKRRDEKLRALKAKLGLDPNAEVSTPTGSVPLQRPSQQPSNPRYVPPAQATPSQPPPAQPTAPSTGPQRTLAPSRARLTSTSSPRVPSTLRPRGNVIHRNQPRPQQENPGPGTPRPQTTPRTPPPARSSGPTLSAERRQRLSEAGISEARLNNIYTSLVNAKRKCNEPTSKISVESVARSIAKQAPAIKQKHNAKAVDFQVVIKNGRAYLKPVPK